MYLPDIHAEHDPEVLRAFIKGHPLGALTTALPHPSIDMLQSTHIPWVLDAPTEAAPLGTLRGHMARGNPQAKAIIDTCRTSSPDTVEDGWGALPTDCLVLFTGPNAYVTARWMVNKHDDTEEVTPTWNFVAVQVYGRVRAHYRGEAAQNFLSKQIDDLSHQQESLQIAAVKGRGVPPNVDNVRYEDDEEWQVDDAPAAFNERLKKGIIGIEIEITKIAGRFKLGQDEKVGAFSGIIKGFEGDGSEEGKVLAKLMRGTGRCPVEV